MRELLGELVRCLSGILGMPVSVSDTVWLCVVSLWLYLWLWRCVLDTAAVIEEGEPHMAFKDRVDGLGMLQCRGKHRSRHSTGRGSTSGNGRERTASGFNRTRRRSIRRRGVRQHRNGQWQRTHSVSRFSGKGKRESVRSAPVGPVSPFERSIRCTIPPERANPDVAKSTTSVEPRVPRPKASQFVYESFWLKQFSRAIAQWLALKQNA